MGYHTELEPCIVRKIISKISEFTLPHLPALQIILSSDTDAGFHPQQSSFLAQSLPVFRHLFESEKSLEFFVSFTTKFKFTYANADIVQTLRFFIGTVRSFSTHASIMGTLQIVN